MVTRSMRRSVTYDGKRYGPGASVSVPASLASALNLRPSDEVVTDENAAGANGQALPPIRALQAHLQTLTTREQVEALMQIDKRGSAERWYDQRLSQLEQSVKPTTQTE